MMKKTIFSLALVVISVLGIIDAGYITYETFTGQVPVCQPPFACSEVLDSPWAYIGPVPLSALGLGYYLTVLTLSALYFLEFDFKKIGLKWPITNVLLGLTTFGFLFSIYLVSIMAFAIKAWCLYCLISATTSSLLFMAGLSLYLTQRSISEPKP